MVLLTGFRRPGKLEEIPGVGGRVASKLIEYFGDEEEAIRAILGCRVSILAEVVGRAAAARIVQGLHRFSFGAWPRDIMRTDDSVRLFNKFRDFIATRVSSRAGRDLLSCLYPVGPKQVAEAKRRLSLVERVLKASMECSDRELNEIRSKLVDLEWPKPVPPKRIKRVLVVVGDERAYREALDKLSGVLDVVYVEEPGEVERVAEERGEVIVYDPEGIYTGRLPRVDVLDVASVAPELIIEYFSMNWRVVDTISKLLDAHSGCIERLLRSVGVEDLNLERVREGLRYARLLRGGELDPSADKEYARLYTALKRLDRVADEVEMWANNELQARLESLEVKLSAAQFLKLFNILREGGEVIELPEEIYEVFEEISEVVEKRLAEELGLSSDEAELVKGVAPRTPSIPYQLDRERLEELRAYLREKLARRRFELLQEIAERVRNLRSELERLVDLLAALDVLLAEASIVREGWGGIPEVSNEYHGVAFIEGIEVSLYGREGVQRVTYVVGDTPFKPDSVKGERVILLTGANSGGKTTLLQTICEISLAAQAGLVVLARRAWVGASDQVYFFSKPTGMVDAGALETTLRILASIATGGGKRLILVDELEAATEASAAARIMAVVVKRLCLEKDAVAVIVTHLAREILAVLDGERIPSGCLRVDGIEARGLDERYNLIVDRNPRFYYLARSTPELVVQKLLHRARGGREKEFYAELLEALKSR